MADSTIGNLPAASEITANDLFVLEQNGEANMRNCTQMKNKSKLFPVGKILFSGDNILYVFKIHFNLLHNNSILVHT